MASSPKLPDDKFLSKVKEPTAGCWLFSVLKKDATMEQFDEARKFVDNHPDCTIVVPQLDNVTMFVYESLNEKDVLQPDTDPRFLGLMVLRGKRKV